VLSPPTVPPLPVIPPTPHPPPPPPTVQPHDTQTRRTAWIRQREDKGERQRAATSPALVSGGGGGSAGSKTCYCTQHPRACGRRAPTVTTGGAAARIGGKHAKLPGCQYGAARATPAASRGRLMGCGERRQSRRKRAATGPRTHIGVSSPSQFLGPADADRTGGGFAADHWGLCLPTWNGGRGARAAHAESSAQRGPQVPLRRGPIGSP